MKRTLIVVGVLVVVVGLAVAALGGGSPAPGLIDSAQLKQLQSNGVRIVDVRTEAEFVGAHIEGSENVPMSEFAQVAQSWDPAAPVALYCATGSRSAEAAQMLQSAGFQNVYDLRSGLMAWDGELSAGSAPVVAAAEPSASGLPVMYEFYTDW